jgi:hypothetical protein
MAVLERSSSSDRSPDRFSETPAPRDYGPAPIDIRLPVRLLWAMVACAILGAFLAAQITNLLGQVNYSAEVDLVGLQLDRPSHGIRIENDILPSILQLARSDVYLLELAQRSGLPPDLDKLRGIVSAIRPRQGGVISIIAVSPDKATIDALAGQLMPTLNVVVDRARQGSVMANDANDRAPLVGTNSNYQGPLYLDPFNGAASRSVGGPPTSTNQVVGALVGVLVLFCIGLGAHARARVTSDERLDEVFGLPQVATVPRRRLFRHRRTQQYMKGVALAVDSMNPSGVNSLGLVGSGIPRTRSNVALSLATAMVDTMERNVVLVDLDIEKAALSRRIGLIRRFPRTRAALGVSDVVTEGFAAQTLVTPVRRRRLPRSIRSLAKSSGNRVYAIGAGTHVGERSFGDESAVIDLIRTLADHAIVLVALPRVPGPAPVQGILNELDASVLLLLDGWSELPPAQAAAAVMNATTTGRDAFLLLEN